MCAKRCGSRLERDPGASHACWFGRLEQRINGTEPVKYSVGPLRDGCEPFRVISIVAFLGWAVGVSEAAGLAATIAARPLEATSMHRRVIIRSPGRVLASHSRAPRVRRPAGKIGPDAASFPGSSLRCPPQIAVAGGGLVLAAILVGAIRSDLAPMAAAVASLLGGIVVWGSNTSTAKEAANEITAAKSKRAGLMEQINPRVIS